MCAWVSMCLFMHMRVCECVCVSISFTEHMYKRNSLSINVCPFILKKVPLCPHSTRVSSLTSPTTIQLWAECRVNMKQNNIGCWSLWYPGKTVFGKLPDQDREVLSSWGVRSQQVIWPLDNLPKIGLSRRVTDDQLHLLLLRSEEGRERRVS